MPSRSLLRSARIQFQKLDTMLLNDVRLFLRDRKSLILVVLTPFLILSILINIFYFSDVADTIRGVKLAVCDMDGKAFEMESDIFTTTTFSKDCDGLVADKVSSGEFRGGVVIPKGFRQDLIDGRGVEMKLFIDNSKQTTAVVTSNAVRAYVADINEKMSTAFILEAWDQLKELNSNLRFLVGNLERAKPIAIELQQRLNAINAEISKIDFASHQQSVSDIISYLDLLDQQLASIDAGFANISVMPQLPMIDQTANVSLAITNYRGNAGIFRSDFCNITEIIPFGTESQLCIVLDYTDNIANSLEAESASIPLYQAELNSRIAELNQNTELVNSSLARLSSMISSSSATNADLRGRIASLRSDIAFLEEKTSNISNSVMELNQSINKFLSDIVRVTDDLNKTIAVLDDYTKKDPSTILRPVRVDEKAVFKGKLEIFYRLPALISIILLFITLFIASSSIVNERRGGTMARIFLSPISMFFYVFEKMLYLLLLCMLTVASMVIAALVFKVPLPISLDLALVFIVASLVYISIGVCIGSFSKSENTSLLTCLVIGFPLMFLSGAFSPPELMSKAFRIASQYLPLTLNVSLLEKITIYHTGLDMTKLMIMASMILVFYLLAVIMIRKKPTLK
jgi:ABC-type multidrug transport system permease subunit